LQRPRSARPLPPQELARQRRRLIDALLAEGFSQSDLARELGVTRQAIQKMVAVGQDTSRR
jgi:biotin operon repressor